MREVLLPAASVAGRRPTGDGTCRAGPAGGITLCVTSSRVPIVQPTMCYDYSLAPNSPRPSNEGRPTTHERATRVMYACARTYTYARVHENAFRAEKFTQNRHKITHVWTADPSGSGMLGSHCRARARRHACERSACVGGLAASLRQPSRARRSLQRCADASPASEAPRAGAQRRAALRA